MSGQTLYKPAEPSIVVNGVPLSEAQALTVRMALASYALHLAACDGLHSEERRESTTFILHLKHLAEVQTLI